MKKEFLSANEVVRDSFALGKKVYDSGFRPDALLCLWRGGTPIGIVVHEYLLYKGVKTYHVAIKAGSYSGIDDRQNVTVEHMDSILEMLESDCKVLLVDDIFDSGNTVKKVCELLSSKTSNVKVATLYYKPDKNQTDMVPDFYLRKSNGWTVFPHEIVGLSDEEIKEKDESLLDLL